MTDAIISIKPKHVKNIIDGVKTAELRTRSIRLGAGDVLWIYSTLPVGSIEAVAIVDYVVTEKKSVIWDKYKEQIFISKADFNDYTKATNIVTLIVFKSIEQMNIPVTLKKLRVVDSKFMPPQFYSKIDSDGEIYNVLQLANKEYSSKLNGR